jgi:hypothetical protein
MVFDRVPVPEPLHVARITVTVVGMTVDEILIALGGRNAVGQALGVSRSAPYNWRQDGIPARHWHVLVQMAAKRGIKGVTFDVLAATGRMGSAREALVIPRHRVRASKSDAPREREVA